MDSYLLLMERANILLCEPSDFMRLWVKKALEGSLFHLTAEATSLQEAIKLIDFENNNGKKPDLVIVSDGLEPKNEAKGAKHLIEYLERTESTAKILGIYTLKKFREQRIKVTTDISRDEVVTNPTNLRNLITEI